MVTIGIGMLGYAFMGKAHSNAYRKIAYLTWPPPLEPKLVGIAGRNLEAVQEAADRYGFEYATDDWRRLVEDASIGLFDNSGPNAQHAEPTLAAARSGKHVVCEKPLGRDAAESYEIWQAVAATGVKHLCGFNYRFVPSIRLAREMVDAGELGEIRHFRARYLQDWGDDPSLDTWRFDRDVAGSGALGDLMTHVVDLARFLNGELTSVKGFAHTFFPGRLPHRHGFGGRSPLLAALVAAGPHHRLGRHLRSRAASPAGRDRQRHRCCALRRDLRGRLPSGGDLRRHRPLRGERGAGGDPLPLRPSTDC